MEHKYFLNPEEHQPKGFADFTKIYITTKLYTTKLYTTKQYTKTKNIKPCITDLEIKLGK